jgi:hypothetical protein
MLMAPQWDLLDARCPPDNGFVHQKPGYAEFSPSILPAISPVDRAMQSRVNLPEFSKAPLINKEMVDQSVNNRPGISSRNDAQRLFLGRCSLFLRSEGRLGSKNAN